jgi:CPA1 family monovalent cation:H+ antiporter
MWPARCRAVRKSLGLRSPASIIGQGWQGCVETHFQTLTVLLLVAAVVAMLTRRLHLPYSVGLVAAGIVLAAVPFAPKIALTKDLLFTVLLPPLLFEAAYYINWRELRRNLPLIAVLATLGVVISAGLTAAGMHYLMHWEWISAVAFGVLIAATDPVSVISTFKDAKAHGRLLVLIEGESLFNDGTAAVGFAAVVAVATGQQVGSMQIGIRLLESIGGGILCGGIVALGALVLAGRTTDHLVEITFTTVAAYGSFLLADHFGFSGVMATITAGLVMSNSTWIDAISPRGKEAVQTFWEYAAFVANSLIFLLIGMHEAHQNLLAVWLPAVVAIALVTLGRAAAIYPCCLLFSRSSLRVTARHQHVLFWGGLRGALALALALGLSSVIPQSEIIIAVSFAVVAFSVFVQGLTVAPMLRKMGEIPRVVS